MSPMTWNEFADYVSIDCETLEQSVELASLQGAAHASVVVDLTTGKTGLSLSSTNQGSVLSSHHPPADCINFLRVRPLLFNTAWRVLDLLIETALNTAGRRPQSSANWPIDDKDQIARRDTEAIRPAQLESSTWSALVETYSRLKTLRHSLIHRTARMRDGHTIVGIDQNGGNLQPFTPEDLDALMRVALRSVEHIRTIPGDLDQRAKDDLVGNLRLLRKFHQVTLPNVALSIRTPTVRVVAGPPDEVGLYEIPIPKIVEEARAALPEFRQADVLIEFVGHPGLTLSGRLELAPHETISVDPLAPPNWLS